MDRQTLRDWVHRYNGEGVEGLKSRSSPGRAPALSEQQMAELRELVIPFGDSGYVALYRHEAADNAVYILAFRHQREAGY